MGDAERAAGADEPGGGVQGSVEPARLAEDRIRSYLSNPTDPNARTNARGRSQARRTRNRQERFEGAKFGIELNRMVVLPSGQMQLTVIVPHDDIMEAFKLRETPGLLLEASVKPVERIIR